MQTSTFSFVLALVTGLAGCSSRAGTEYKGEPLLRVTGKVVMQDDSSSDLVPALAYWPGDLTDFRLVDVDVTGQFPAGFTLDIFEPPPDELLFWLGGRERPFPEDPRIAFAYITAVAPDHPDVIQQIINVESGVGCGVCPVGEPTCALPPGPVCTRSNKWCNSDLSSCYEEFSECSSPDATSCVVTSSTGDSKLKNHWARFPGLSQDYFLLYLEADATVNTAVAFAFGGRKSMGRGYHLIALRELSTEEQAAAELCRQGSGEEAVARYNAEHGTAYASWADVTDDKVSGAIKLIEFRILTERNCQDSRVEYTPVASSAEHPVTIHISPDVRPLDVLPGG